MNSLMNNRQSKRSLTIGRKRNRLGLATFASALAISMSAPSSVSAFQTALPSSAAARPLLSNSFDATRQRPTTSLHVVTDPEVLISSMDHVTFATPSSIKRQQLSGVKKDNRRKLPPRVSLKSTVDAKVKDDPSLSLDPVTSSRATTTNTISSTRLRQTPSSALPARRRKQPVQRSPRQKTTMPGFQNGDMTGRQQAFRDGIRLVEGRTGKKLAQYVDTPEARKKRRQANGEAMYKTSASVPDSLVQFANQIHTIDRITPREEIELGELTQEAIRLQNLHDDLAQTLARPPTDEEWCAAAGKINLEAISQAIEEGLDAKNKLVTANLRMVQGVVNLYIRNGLGGQYNAGDLMQEGIMALIRAAEKFDPSRGFRFSTYAMYWIRAAVKRSQIVQSRVITVPQRLYENHKRILRTEKELRITLDRPPTKAELCEAVGMSELQLDRCVTAMKQRCFSLDQSIQNKRKPMNGDQGAESLIEIVESKIDDTEANGLNRQFFREDLLETLHRHLTPEEVELLKLRYGLTDDMNSDNGMTIASVSEVVGLKPDKVRRMLNKSIKQLQVAIGDEWKDYELEFQ